MQNSVNFDLSMPYKNKPVEKLYYTIGEVAEMFSVNASLIRFWEKEFDVLKPKKSVKGNRLFTKADIENIRTIYHLVKEKGHTLQGARDALKKDAKPAQNGHEEVILYLLRIRKELVDIRDNYFKQ